MYAGFDEDLLNQQFEDNVVADISIYQPHGYAMDRRNQVVHPGPWNQHPTNYPLGCMVGVDNFHGKIPNPNYSPILPIAPPSFAGNNLLQRPTRVEMLDLVGKMIRISQVQGWVSEYVLSLDDLPAGVYLLRLGSEERLRPACR